MRVKLLLALSWPGAKEPRVLEKEVDLPFAPYPGLTIWFGEIDDDDENGSFTVDEVDYSLKTQVFECAKSIELREYALPGATIGEMLEHETEDALRVGFVKTCEGSPL